MKNAALLLTIILFSAIGCSESKENESNSINGMDIIITKPAISQIKDTNKNPIIAEINEAKSVYIETLARDWFKYKEEYIKNEEINGSRVYFGSYIESKMSITQDLFKNNFYRIEGHQGLKTNEVFKIYNDYLKFATKKCCNHIETSGITGKWFDEYK